MGKLNITFEKKSKFKIESRGKMLYVDQPLPEGEDSALTPLELFVASVGACAAYFAVVFLKRKGIRVEGAQFTINYERDKNPYRVKKIEIEASFPEKIEDENLIKGAIRSALNCPVHNSIKHPLEISFFIRD